MFVLKWETEFISIRESNIDEYFYEYLLVNGYNFWTKKCNFNLSEQFYSKVILRQLRKPFFAGDREISF